MADIPSVETADDALRRASQSIDALKRAKPANAAEARLRAAELMRTQQDLIDAARKASDAAVAKKFTNGGSAKAAGSKPRGGISDLEIRALAKALVPFLYEVIAAELEKKRVLTDGGIWNSEKTYRPGAVVTFDGAPWVCQQPNKSTKPGKSDAWRLQGKSHR